MNNRSLKLLIACIAALAAGCARAHPTLAPTPDQRIALVLPAPKAVTPERGQTFAIRPDSVITIDREDEDLRRIAGVLADLIGATPVDMPRVVVGTDALAPGSLNLSLGGDPALGDEGYDLTIGVNGFLWLDDCARDNACDRTSKLGKSFDETLVDDTWRVAFFLGWRFLDLWTP